MEERAFQTSKRDKKMEVAGQEISEKRKKAEYDNY